MNKEIRKENIDRLANFMADAEMGVKSFEATKTYFIEKYEKYNDDELAEEIGECLEELYCFHCGKELGVGDNDCEHCMNESDLKKTKTYNDIHKALKENGFDHEDIINNIK